jgi:hypothetical protein
MFGPIGNTFGPLLLTIVCVAFAGFIWLNIWAALDAKASSKRWHAEWDRPAGQMEGEK